MPDETTRAVLPGGWQGPLQHQLDSPWFRALMAFIAAERRAHRVFPPEEDVYRALELTPYERVKVVILGQDPYHDEGQAHGLCFSVRPGVKPPPSLVNIFKELATDLGRAPPMTGCLEGWAKQGVLLLNTVLTVRAHEAHSHRKRGWEKLTDGIISAVSDKPTPVVFVLWGAPAQKKARLIDDRRHVILQSPHPSPLSAYAGFFGSRPFSKVNEALRAHGQAPIDWLRIE